jgi:hypothetical protein
MFMLDGKCSRKFINVCVWLYFCEYAFSSLSSSTENEKFNLDIVCREMWKSLHLHICTAASVAVEAKDRMFLVCTCFFFVVLPLLLRLCLCLCVNINICAAEFSFLIIQLTRRRAHTIYVCSPKE